MWLQYCVIRDISKYERHVYTLTLVISATWPCNYVAFRRQNSWKSSKPCIYADLLLEIELVWDFIQQLTDAARNLHTFLKAK